MSEELGRAAGTSPADAPYSFGGPWSPSDVELGRRAARKARLRKNAIVATLSTLLVLGTLAIIIVTSPGWKSLSQTFFAWAYGLEVLPKIILGFTTNIILTVVQLFYKASYLSEN